MNFVGNCLELVRTHNYRLLLLLADKKEVKNEPLGKSSEYGCDWCHDTFKTIEQLKLHELTSCPELQQPRNNLSPPTTGSVPSTESISKLISQITKSQESHFAAPDSRVHTIQKPPPAKPDFSTLTSISQFSPYGNSSSLSPTSAPNFAGATAESQQLKEVLDRLSARSREHLSPSESLNSGILTEQQKFLIYQHNQQRIRQQHSQFLASQHRNFQQSAAAYISSQNSGAYQEYLKRLSASNSLHALNEAIRSAKMASKSTPPPLEKPGVIVPPPPQLLRPTTQSSAEMFKASEPRQSLPETSTRPAMCHICRIQFTDIEYLARHYIDSHPSLLPGLSPAGSSVSPGLQGMGFGSGSQFRRIAGRTDSVIQPHPSRVDISSPLSNNPHFLALSNQGKLAISSLPVDVSSAHREMQHARLPPPPVSIFYIILLSGRVGGGFFNWGLDI